MGILVKGFGCLLHGFICGDKNSEQLFQPFIQICLGNPPFLDGVHKANGGVRAGGGHYQIGAVLYTQSMVIVSAPVGNHEAVEAPVIPEYLLQEMGILVGIGAVDLVVAGHDGSGLALFYGDLKAGKVDFPQRALVHHAVHGHPPQLLRIDGKMLGAGGDAVFLNAPDIGGGHFTGKIGVFREILKVPPAQGAALHIESRPQQNVYTVRGSFPAQRSAQLLPQRFIPGIGHGGRRREAGGGDGSVQSQMVAGACLLAQAVRAVGKEAYGDPRILLFIACPGRPSLQEGRFFFQRQRIDCFIYDHANHILISSIDYQRHHFSKAV